MSRPGEGAGREETEELAQRLRGLDLRDVELPGALRPAGPGSEGGAPRVVPPPAVAAAPGEPDELAALGLTEAAGLVASGQLSSAELTAAVLARVDRYDGALQAYVEVYADDARAAAATADAASARGEAAGPLHGLPVALKDLYDVAGRATLAGSAVRAGHVATADSEVTRRLGAAGAVLLGKTVTHEFAFGVVSAPTRNPWDLGTIPGGSSGGSGAAVAADLCLMGMGSDTGGSIRIPAGLCGVVGLKPTFGRVSKRGVAPLSWSLDHAGPLTKTVADAALVLQVIAGFDPLDRTSADVPVPDHLAGLAAGVRGLRIGVPTNFFFALADAEVAAAVHTALGVLAEAGAVLVDVAVPDVELVADVISVIAGVEASAIHQDEMRTVPEAYTDEVRERLRVGELISGTAYVNGQRARAVVQDGFATAFGSVDVLVSPTLPIPAPAYGSTTAVVAGQEHPILYALNCLTAPANAAGLPALALPCGLTGGGLPISLQVMGRPFDEATVLRVGAAYEAATAWHQLSPPLPG